MKSGKSENARLGILNTLGLIFIFCKIFEIGSIAQWSWLLVLSPIIANFCITLFVLIVIVISTLIMLIKK